MYRIAIAAAVFSLIAVACTGSSETTTTTEAPTTTSSTTTSSTTSTTTTTMAPLAAAFPREPGTPTGELDSFTGTTDMTFSAEGLDAGFETLGTFVGDAFECTTTMDFGGFRLTATGVATPERSWVDAGQGFVEVGLLDPDLDTAIGVCAANPAFWEGGSFAFPAVEGEPDTINGIPVQRVEFSELLGALSAFGFAELGGLEFENAVFWIADDGGWVAGFDMTFLIQPESAAAFFGPGLTLTEPAEMTMIMRIADPNDPTLSVQLPE